MSKIRWDIILTVLGAVAATVAIFTDFSLNIEDALYFAGFVAMFVGVGAWAKRRRQLRDVPPPPVPVQRTEP